MFTVGRPASSSSDSSQSTSCTQCSTPICCLGEIFILTFGIFANQRFLFRIQRPGLFHVAVDRRRVAVRTDQRRQRLHQVPRRTIDASFIGRMQILPGPAMPTFAARHQLQLHHSLGAQVDGHRSIERLHRHRHVNAGALPKRGQNIRPMDNLRKVGRTDLLLAFGDEHEVHRAACGPRLETRAARRATWLPALAGSPRRGRSAPFRGRACRRCAPQTAAKSTRTGSACFTSYMK